MIDLFVPGIPKPQGSKNFYANGGMRESSKGLPAWRKQIVDIARTQGLHHNPAPAVPLSLSLVFVMPRLKAHYRTGRFAGLVLDHAPLWHTTYPDGSKLQRAVEDALVIAGVIPDDRYIAEWTGSKVYGQTTGVWIHIKPIEDDY